MSKKPWEDKVSEEESEEVVDADFLDDEDEFEDFEEEGDTSSDEDQEKSGFINSSFCSLFSIHQILEEVKLRRLRNL